MKSFGPWDNSNFDEMMWHDSHFYGFRMENFNDGNGSCDLIFDIDYILEWHKTEDSFMFTVSQAELIFHDASKLNIALEYDAPPAGMCPFMIDGINREEKTYVTGYKSFDWKIAVSWPPGNISFSSQRFTQKLVGKPVYQDSQSLEETTRKP